MSLIDTDLKQLEAHRDLALSLLAQRPQQDLMLADTITQATSVEEIIALLRGKKRRRAPVRSLKSDGPLAQMAFDFEPEPTATQVADEVEPDLFPIEVTVIKASSSHTAVPEIVPTTSDSETELADIENAGNAAIDAGSTIVDRSITSPYADERENRPISLGRPDHSITRRHLITQRSNWIARRSCDNPLQRKNLNAGGVSPTVRTSETLTRPPDHGPPDFYSGRGPPDRKSPWPKMPSCPAGTGPPTR